MEQEKQEEKATIQSPLCAKCHSFYGNSSMENMCSKCYKETYPDQQQQKPLNKKAEENKLEQEEPKPECLQTDHNRCWTCKKKVNLLGIQCKCQYTFCNKHRMPEDHECEFDHTKLALEKLKKANPEIGNAKMKEKV